MRSSVTVGGTATPSSHCGSVRVCARPHVHAHTCTRTLAPAPDPPWAFTAPPLSSALPGTPGTPPTASGGPSSRQRPCAHRPSSLPASTLAEDSISVSVVTGLIRAPPAGRFSAPLTSPPTEACGGFQHQSSFSSSAHPLARLPASILRRSLAPLSQHIRRQHGFTTATVGWSVIFAPPHSRAGKRVKPGVGGGGWGGGGVLL